MLLRGLLHALLAQDLELTADQPGLSLEFAQEGARLVLDRAVGEDHPPQPGGRLGVDPLAPQDVVLDGLVEESLEGRRAVLYALVQLDEEVGPLPVELAAGVE